MAEEDSRMSASSAPSRNPPMMDTTVSTSVNRRPRRMASLKKYCAKTSH